MTKHTPLDQQIDKTGECWIWLGALDPQGYGRKSGSLAHRYMYKRAVGPIPKGLELDHLCRNTRCVNPAHLEPVTRAENMRRRAALITACVNGHSFDDINTYWRPNGNRDCRICAADRARTYRERKAA